MTYNVFSGTLNPSQSIKPVHRVLNLGSWSALHGFKVMVVMF